MFNPSVSEKRCIEKLNRAEARRIERYRNLRCVYAYRRKGSSAVCDNLLLLPYSEKDAHAIFLTNLLKQLAKENRDKFADVSVVLVGTFDVVRLKFDTVPERILVKCSDVFSEVEK